MKKTERLPDADDLIEVYNDTGIESDPLGMYTGIPYESVPAAGGPLLQRREAVPEARENRPADAGRGRSVNPPPRAPRLAAADRCPFCGSPLPAVSTAA